MSVGVVALCLVVVALAQTDAGANAMRSIGLAAPAEPYTELYFTNSQMIAALSDTNQRQSSRFHLRFVVHNAGRVTQTYRWTVTQGSKVVLRGAATLAAGHFGFEGAELRLCPKHRVARARRKARRTLRMVSIAVVLLQPSRSIHAQVVCDD